MSKLIMVMLLSLTSVQVFALGVEGPEECGDSKLLEARVVTDETTKVRVPSTTSTDKTETETIKY